MHLWVDENTVFFCLCSRNASVWVDCRMNMSKIYLTIKRKNRVWLDKYIMNKENYLTMEPFFTIWEENKSK